jgi:archaellum component FlaC
MSIKQVLATMAALAAFTVSAHAYEYTGVVRTIDTSSSWPHWQQIQLGEGDVSVGPHCDRFVRVLNDPNFTVADCIEVAEILSGTDQHERLPVGQLMWVPYVPQETTVAAVLQDFDLTVMQSEIELLQAEFATTKVTYLTVDQLTQMLRSETETLQRSIDDQIASFRTQFVGEQSDINQAFLNRLEALETAMEDGQSATSNVTAEDPQALIALIAQVEDLEVLKANYASLTVRMDDVEGDVSDLQGEVESVSETAATNAENVDSLSTRVQALEQRPQEIQDQASGPDWFWWLVGLTVTVLLLGIWLFRQKSRLNHKESGLAAAHTVAAAAKQSSEDQGVRIDSQNQTLQSFDSRLSEVEELTRLWVVTDAEGNFKCPEFETKLDQLAVGDDPIRLSVPIKGASGTKIDVFKRKDDNGNYLELFGVKAGQGRIDPKTANGKERFTVTQVWLKIKRAEKSGSVIGLTEARKAS